MQRSLPPPRAVGGVSTSRHHAAAASKTSGCIAAGPLLRSACASAPGSPALFLRQRICRSAASTLGEDAGHGPPVDHTAAIAAVPGSGEINPPGRGGVRATE